MAELVVILMIQTFYIDMLPSLNEYAHSVQVRRSAHSKRGKIFSDVAWQLKQQKVQAITHYPVDVLVTGYFQGGVKTYDRTNMAGPWKIIEDAMVKQGLLRGDTDREIGYLVYLPSETGSDRNRVQVQIIEGDPRLAYMIESALRQLHKRQRPPQLA